MRCVSCGRQNQPTTRFCAECGDVLRADPPRKRRATRRIRRKRIHWVRVPTRPTPSVLSAAVPASPEAADRERTPERMMRRVDLVFAAMVGVAALAAYVAYPYLKRPAAVETASVSVPPVAIAPMLLPEPERRPEAESPAPEVPASPPPAASPSPAKPDIVPSRAPAQRTEVASRRTPDAGAAAQSPRSPLALSTRFGSDGVNGVATSPPTRVAAAPPAAPARKDRLQQMNDTIADCAKEGLFGRIACEQRALLAYCDGQWGRNDRCPSGRTADYGN